MKNEHIEELIHTLTNQDHTLAYKALQELVSISETCDEVYVYFDEFITLMKDPKNSYVRTRGLRLIAYQAKWDRENKIHTILPQWLSHLEDEKPITVRQCIKDCVVIAKDKPELIPTLLHALENSHTTYPASMQSLIYKDRQKAIRQIKQLTW